MSINRRDYLKKMTLSAVALGASRLEVLGQRGRSKIKPNATKTTPDSDVQAVDALTDNFKSWPDGPLPATPTIKIHFRGLLDFYYNPITADEGFCGVGFVKDGERHRPMIEVTEDGHPWLPAVEIDHRWDVRIAIVNSPAHDQEQPASARFLKSGGADDFRWLIDMQSRSWYPGTKAKGGNYAAKLFIRNGTFFTEERTCNKLRQALKVEQLGVSYLPGGDLGHPADVVGCAIQLGANEAVALNVNGQPKFMENNGKKYEVWFSNMCADNTPHGPCSFEWNHFQEVKRNDFHHHRNALEPGFVAKLSVVITGQPNPACSSEMPKTKGDQHKENTAEAPCMGAGYGGGPGPA